MRRVIWTPGAVREAGDIRRYVEEHDPRAARSLLSRLQRRARMLARYPEAGRVVPEAQRKDVRELIEGSYRLIYRVDDAVIRVLSVLHSRRAPTSLDARAWDDDPDDP